MSGSDSKKFAAIAFPTDRITLGEMRKGAGGISRDVLGSVSPTDIEALALHYWELTLAEKVVANVLSEPEPAPYDSRRSIISDILDPGYQKYGLSSGKASTEQLVRAFEAQVRQLVKSGRTS